MNEFQRAYNRIRKFVPKDDIQNRSAILKIRDLVEITVPKPLIKSNVNRYCPQCMHWFGRTDTKVHRWEHCPTCGQAILRREDE